MNKTILFVMTALMLMGAAMAATYECGNNGFDCECQTFKGDSRYFALEKWSFDTGSNSYVREMYDPAFTYVITVDGDAKSAQWTSDLPVDTVIVKAGDDRVEWNDGDNTQFGGSGSSEKEISHITFCGWEEGGSKGPDRDSSITALFVDPDNGKGVPEFSTLTLGVAVLITTIGLVYLRKAE